MAEHDEHPPHAEPAAGAGKGDDAKVKNALERKLGKHYPLVIVLVTVVGVVIAWLTFRRSSSSSVSGLDPNAGATYTSGAGVGLPTGGGGGTAGGGANAGLAAALANQSHILQHIEATLRRRQAPGGTAPGFNFDSMNHSWAGEPVNAPARFLYGRAAKGLAYIKNRATGVIYQINPNGKRYALTAAQYAELGRPKVTLFGRPRSEHHDNRNPTPGTPRRRRVRRGWQNPRPRTLHHGRHNLPDPAPNPPAPVGYRPR